MAIAMSISRNRRRGILDVHKGVCHYCGGVACQIDHVVPKVAGGTDDLGNLTATCAPCNQRKGPRRLLG